MDSFDTDQLNWSLNMVAMIRHKQKQTIHLRASLLLCVVNGQFWYRSSNVVA